MDTNIDTNKMEEYTNIISNMLVSYKNNEYMTNKIHQIMIGLPETLDIENKKYEERLSKFNELLSEQDNFFKVFLSKNQYYYMPFNSLYYEYDGKTFKIVNEDDIYHKLLSTITNEGKLLQWKHKTKQMMMKKIKERLLVKALPESETIQNVLNFCKTFFETKAEAKYFLTIIGDCILKKNTVDMYFVSSSLKKILSLIDSVCYITTGNTILSNFITKYHDSHNLHTYRLLKTSEASDTISCDIIKNMINDIGIDLLVVASHYSDQYTNANNYLALYCDNSNVSDYSLYFVNNSIDNIIENFIKSCIEVTNTIDSQISWSNMHFIWKQFIASLNIPNMLYASNLQQHLMKYIQFTNMEGHIIFIGVTSKYLPNVSSFLSFWNKYITIGEFDTEYEIDELCTLYKSTEFKNLNINDKSMLYMLSHFYPELEITDNKFITNIKCTLWNKVDDINEFINHYIATNKNKGTSSSTANEILISFDSLYQKYRTYYKSKSIVDKQPLFIVSKQYFENFIVVNLSNNIQFEKFLFFNFLEL
jgi:hypothetical protein